MFTVQHWSPNVARKSGPTPHGFWAGGFQMDSHWFGGCEDGAMQVGLKVRLLRRARERSLTHPVRTCVVSGGSQTWGGWVCAAIARHSGVNVNYFSHILLYTVCGPAPQCFNRSFKKATCPYTNICCPDFSENIHLEMSWAQIPEFFFFNVYVNIYQEKNAVSRELKKVSIHKLQTFIESFSSNSIFHLWLNVSRHKLKQ